MTITEPDRQKFERLKEQADIMRQYVEDRLAGGSTVFEYRRHGNIGAWYPVNGDCMWQLDFEYRRKPEPTVPKSPLSLAGQNFVETFLSDGADGAEIEIIARHQRFKLTAQPIGAPEPTLEERNKAVMERWEAMEETNSKDVRRRNGRKFTWDYRSILHPEYGWKNDPNQDPAWYNTVEYRIRELPEPKIVPFDFATCPLGAHVQWKEVARKATISTVFKDTFSASTWSFTYAEGLKYLWLIPDPSKPSERRPFGREVA